MLRLAALGLACSLGFATPTMAVPVTFVLNRDAPSSIDFDCIPSASDGSCGLNAPTFSFQNGANIVADPDSTFKLLRFEANQNDDSDDSNGDEDSDDETEDDDILSGTFTTTVKLFMLAGGSDLISLMSTGTGSYTTQDGAIRNFSLIWSPIANFTVDGVGAFSAAFENIDLVAATGFRSEDDDEWEDKGKYGVKVSASITPVPLPAGAWLLLSGLAVLGATRMRRRRVA